MVVKEIGYSAYEEIKIKKQVSSINLYILIELTCSLLISMGSFKFYFTIETVTNFVFDEKLSSFLARIK